MSNSYTPAAKLFGRRIRIMYVAVLVLLFLARMWSVHGVHGFLATDAAHSEIAGIAGRLPGLSTEVTLAAFVFQVGRTADLVERSIEDWRAQHAKVARLLAPVCAAGDDMPCAR